MNIVRKVRCLGVGGVIRAIKRKIAQNSNRLIYFFFKHLPIQNNLIVLESEGDLCDNAFALYDFMLRNGYLNKYTIAWLVDELPKRIKTDYINTQFVTKEWQIWNPSLMKYLATCRYYIYDHNHIPSYLNVELRNGQYCAYLSHGGGFKSTKGNYSAPFDVMFATGEMPANRLTGMRARSTSPGGV